MNKILFFLFLLFVTVVPFQPTAEALRITLKRVVFEGPKRAEVLTVINNSDREETYRLGWRHFKMTENKGLEYVPDDALISDIKPVTDMVRYAPRRFTVPPKSSQQIRLILRTPANLPDGEYRSHFWVNPEANTEVLRREAIEKNKKRGVKNGVSMSMLTGITIPIIVRKGNLSVAVSVSDFAAEDVGDSIKTNFSLVKEGDRSSFGEVRLTCNEASNPYVLKLSRGVAIYPEIDKRNFNFRIDKEVGQAPCNTLTLSYTETDGYGGDVLETLSRETITVKR